MGWRREPSTSKKKKKKLKRRGDQEEGGMVVILRRGTITFPNFLRRREVCSAVEVLSIY